MQAHACAWLSNLHGCTGDVPTAAAPRRRRLPELTPGMLTLTQGQLGVRCVARVLAHALAGCHEVVVLRGLCSLFQNLEVRPALLAV